MNSLVVTTGEVLTNQPADPPYSTERRFRDVNLEVLYFNSTIDPNQNCDRSGPTIAAGPLPGSLYHSVDGTLIQWAVPASDPAGLKQIFERIDSLETSEIKQASFRRYEERYRPFLLGSALLFATAGLLFAGGLRVAPV